MNDAVTIDVVLTGPAKVGGERRKPGATVSVDAVTLDHLVQAGAAERPVALAGAGALSQDEREQALKDALAELSDDAFKKDGGIRADALRELVGELGFEVTAERVAELRGNQS